MLTLCRLGKQVAIPQPRSAQLKRFTFFTSRSQHRDGTERIYLHMGYFATLSEAQTWVGFMRSAYPSAVATPTSHALLQQSNSGVPTALPAALTDSQVIQILETRGSGPAQESAGDKTSAPVEVFRPEETITRHSLKDAVVKGVPVAFAVQLHWSVEPIDLSSVPALDIFKAYTLYTSVSRRVGRSCHFLRLGFFKDAISAKQVAVYVRSKFASAAIVPVTEPEVAHAREGGMDPYSPADAFQQGLDRALDADDENVSTTPNGRPEKRSAPPPPVQSSSATRGPEWAMKPDAAPKKSEETLQETLELLAASEIWSDPESFSDTGVRHLSVSVEKRKPKRS
jgi:hypothetical protein